jgi:hypothetical protein
VQRDETIWLREAEESQEHGVDDAEGAVLMPIPRPGARTTTAQKPG